MGKKIKIVLIAICVALAFTGVAIWGLVQKSGDELKENTTIKIEGETSKTLHANLSGFYPGASKEYTINLSGDSAKDYEISLSFRDDNSEGLKNYLTVEIVTGEKSIEKSLSELLEGKEITLGKNATEIKIAYSMPTETGNEAQGASAAFYIDLKAKS